MDGLAKAGAEGVVDGLEEGLWVRGEGDVRAGFVASTGAGGCWGHALVGWIYVVGRWRGLCVHGGVTVGLGVQ